MKLEMCLRTEPMWAAAAKCRSLLSYGYDAAVTAPASSHGGGTATGGVCTWVERPGKAPTDGVRGGLRPQ